MSSTSNTSALEIANPVTGGVGTTSSRGAGLRSTATAAGGFGHIGTWAARSPLTFSLEPTEAGGGDVFAP